MKISFNLNFFIPLVIFVIAISIAVSLLTKSPKAKRKVFVASSPLVVALEVYSKDTEIKIHALAVVKPIQEVIIRPQVTGMVTSFSENLQPGRQVKKDELLLNIDPMDYQIEVSRQKNAVAKAKAELALEMGQQRVAKAELKQLQSSISGFEQQELSKDSEALAERAPHLALAKATLAAVYADLKEAKIALKRTQIHAPFNALVIERLVSIGSQASTSDTLATIVNTDEYWVEAMVPLSRLRAIRMKGSETIPVTIRLSSGFERQGFVSQIIGKLDDKSRLGRVLITVKDPLVLEKENHGLASMVLGDHVQVEIHLGKRDGIISLPRIALKNNSTVWAIKNGTLDILAVDILWREADTIYVKKGLLDGALIITSSLSAPMQGMSVRVPKHDNVKPAKVMINKEDIL